jgi:hypothetical protein
MRKLERVPLDNSSCAVVLLKHIAGVFTYYVYELISSFLILLLVSPKVAASFEYAASLMNRPACNPALLCISLLQFPASQYADELPALRSMTREAVVAALRRGSSGFSRGMSKYRGDSMLL